MIPHPGRPMPIFAQVTATIFAIFSKNLIRKSWRAYSLSVADGLSPLDHASQVQFLSPEPDRKPRPPAGLQPVV
jgi:hypothetical protein